MQEGVIANLRRGADQVQRQLLAAESYLAGLQRVLAQRRSEEERRAQRREQAEMDEMAAQLFARTHRQSFQGNTL
jgi:flagellar biosynthesis chaperone FliJ